MNPVLLISLLLLPNMCSTSAAPSLAASPVTAGAPPVSSTTRPAFGVMSYNLSQPAATYVMPSELAELSGIALDGPNGITGVEDETGNLYHYSLTSRKLERTVKFAGNGDFEDLAGVGNDWFILRSDGTLFQYNGTTTQEFETGLTFANEPEGLAYDAATKTLLVACKGDAGANLPATKRAVYRLQRGTYRAETKPAFVLDIAAIGTALPTEVPETKQSGKKAGKKGSTKASSRGFAPSAVAVHPRTSHVFVLSARQNTLVELSPTGELIAAQSLPTDLFPQPEGLAFAPDGSMYIATEAGKKSGQASIYLFRTAR
ncbi:SdiA-regulated domain-containing protein [Hymenobacter sp. BT683]|uniref:SdiA-regulated domain-containing protein n=1 Tax=Hymenobacter jeongseonensis TaxID=2791027 RepID=A0ABS0ICT2_9BACT|nr:SdiA-regulated domain-containing protein [Hymenobacter jeongseonensis]MBF9235864.1 SdiA-regulated domain-containing protein [Hymenobacter jeongseonensis]